MITTMGRAATKLPSDILELLDISWAPGEGGLHAFLGELLRSCERWFQASGASIFLRQDDSLAFVIAARAGSDAAIPEGATIEEGKGIAGASIQSGEALLINDPSDHPLLAKRKLAKREGIQSALVLPLASPGSKCHGVINLSRKEGQEPFNDADLQNAKAMAKYVTLAVSNARMLAEIRASKDQAESARTRLQAVISSLGVAVVIVDATGSLVGKNSEAEKLLGEIGENRFVKAPQALKDALEKALNEALKGKVSRARPRDEQEDRTWSVIATPVPSGGATAVVEEITEAERAHVETARLSRLAEIGQMTATIAHEIRNPLTGIRSAAQMVSISPEDAQKFGRVIEQESIKLNELCDEFLDFAKPISIKRRPVNLGEVAKRLAAAHYRQFHAAKVHLELEIESSEPTIELDELRVEQVVRNLLLNALQASGPEDVVRLEVRDWGIAVEDKGCGMTPEILERLFTPFFTTKSQGTGLGLSTCRKIVEAHGGFLRVTSKPGQGTRFDVVLQPEVGELRLSA
jgi:signal transduction histidine kinase